MRVATRHDPTLTLKPCTAVLCVVDADRAEILQPQAAGQIGALRCG